MHVKKLDMIILMQPDLVAAVNFYKSLGLKLKFHLKDKWAEFRLDGIKVGLCPTQKPDHNHDRRTGLVFEVDDVRKIVAEKKDGFIFINEPIEKLHGIMVSVKDPGGNIIDLYQPTPEKVKQLIKQTAEKGCCGGQCKCAAKPDTVAQG